MCLNLFPYKTTCPVALLDQSITSGNIPELPATANHGLWSYLSGKVFLQGSSAGINCLAIWKSGTSGTRTQDFPVMSRAF